MPGGTRRNLAWIRDRLDAGAAHTTTTLLLADAQTSGGLVFGVDPGQAPGVARRLRETGHDAAVIGRTRPGGGDIRLS